MEIESTLSKKVWWKYLKEDIRELLNESVLLMQKAEFKNEKFHDYSFVVFPAAKAYEGFLKQLFLDLGFIKEDDFYSKHFRVGKALNPNLDKYLRKSESVYDKVVNFCQGRELADSLWDTWKKGRNLLFHWFPNEVNAITFEEAKTNVEMIINSIDIAFKECKVGK